jgi:hypothetical protein
MFRSTTIIRELVLCLTKVMLEHLCPYRLCGGDDRRPKHVGAMFM